jgi:hypothetical protein
MKVKSIKDAAKKKVTKSARVVDISKDANTKKASSEKMTLQDVRAIAEKMGVDAGSLNKTELIRAIQRAEGNNDCYASAQVQTCGQTNCLWHQDCALC